jgi:hypothetical protein
VKQLAPLAAILACCGVKLLIIGAVLAPAGFLTSNVALGLVGLVVSVVLVALAVRRRRSCSGACHVPQKHAAGTRSHSAPG